MVDTNKLVKRIQELLGEKGTDALLFYGFRAQDPIPSIVFSNEKLARLSRRWFYLIPAKGEQVKLCHVIERQGLDSLPGKETFYGSWEEMKKRLSDMLSPYKRIAMDYSPQNEIPYISRVDGGTIELIKSIGKEIVSSAEIIAALEAKIHGEILDTHIFAAERLYEIMNQAFEIVRKHKKEKKKIHEFELRMKLLEIMENEGLETDFPPIVAFGKNSGNPHYFPDEKRSSQIEKPGLLLIDMWARKKDCDFSVYADITWTAFIGDKIPEEVEKVFKIVIEARDSGIDFIREKHKKGEEIRGFMVDGIVRGVIKNRGYAKYFIHRTGHSIGRENHGLGANMDDFECHDTRLILPFSLFSIEPGIYLKEFGIRSEVDVYVGNERGDVRVTGGKPQKDMILI